MIYYDERAIETLRGLLDKENIPYEFYKAPPFLGEDERRYAIRYYGKIKREIMDVDKQFVRCTVINYGESPMEFCLQMSCIDSMKSEEEMNRTVIGNLSVLDVFERIKADWDSQEVEIANGVLKKYYFEKADELVIPRSVQVIGDNAVFAENLGSVIVPKGVAIIGSKAFANHKCLVIKLPASVKHIAEDAFSSGNPRIYAPEGSYAYEWAKRHNYLCGTLIYHLDGNVALIDCDMPCWDDDDPILTDDDAELVEKIVIPDGEEYVDLDKISNCVHLKSLFLPGSLNPDCLYNWGQWGDKVGRRYRMEFNALEEISISSGMTQIAANAFQGLQALQRIMLPESLVEIGECAFCNTALTELAIPDSVRIIGGNAFAYTPLKEVKLPDSLVEIGYGAFKNTSLTEISFPSGLVAICEFAFQNCNVVVINIPGSVKNIGKYAFEGCSLRMVTIEEGVKEIGDYAFSGNYINEIVLPSSIKIVGEMGSDIFGNPIKVTKMSRFK